MRGRIPFVGELSVGGRTYPVAGDVTPRGPLAGCIHGPENPRPLMDRLERGTGADLVVVDGPNGRLGGGPLPIVVRLKKGAERTAPGLEWPPFARFEGAADGAP